MLRMAVGAAGGRPGPGFAGGALRAVPHRKAPTFSL